MATVYGVNREKLNNPVGSNILDEALNRASVACIYDEREISSLPANDTIKVGGNLPPGSRVVRIDVVFTGFGTGRTIDVGDSIDPDRYIDGADTSSAGIASFPNGVTVGSLGLYKVGTADGDDQIQITNLGGTATGTIKIWIHFML